MCLFAPYYRYGSIFKTNVAGRPVIISADREFNYYILRQDGRLVDTWSLDTFAEVFEQASQSSRKYTRNLTLNHFGVEALKDKLIPKMEDFVHETLHAWSSKDSIELKSASVKVTTIFIAYIHHPIIYIHGYNNFLLIFFCCDR